MKTWLEQAQERGLITDGKLVDLTAPPVVFGKSINLVDLPDSLSENDFQDCFIDLAHSLRWRVAHFRKVRVQRKDGSTFWETPVAADGKGFLDTELVRERLIKVELKVGRNTPTEEQEAWIAAYEEAGIEHYVWYPKDWPDIVKTLTRKQ